jgi:hypothetical protein
MPKFSAIPDFTNNLESMATSLRAMKDVVEQLAGLRQGASLGAPSIYMQSIEPRETSQNKFKKGDLWISAENTNRNAPNVTSEGNLYYWDGGVWRQLTFIS